MRHLAITPTRRETIRAVFDAIRGDKKAALTVLTDQQQALRSQVNVAKNEFSAIANNAMDAKYKPVLGKVRRALAQEFPDANVHFTADLGTWRQNGGLENVGVPIHVRLWVDGTSKTETIDQTTHAALVAANEKIDIIAVEAEKLTRPIQQAQLEVRRFGEENIAELLKTIVPVLGDEAGPHLDALSKLIEAALARQITK